MKKYYNILTKYKFPGLMILMSAICSMNFAAPVFSVSEKTLYLNEAVIMSVKNSSGIKDTRLELVKKQIELKEAKEAIADIRKKESTVRFSLLFKIKMPEKHALPKEIELIMKIPAIESSISELTQKLEYEKRNARYMTETAFIDVVELMDSVALNKELLEDYKKTIKRIEADCKLGNASTEDCELLKKEIEKQSLKYTQEILRFENAKKKLGKVINMDVRSGYTFGKDFSSVLLTRDNLEDIISYSVKNDFELFKAAQATKIADRKLSELRNIYNNRWGEKVSIIEQELQKTGEIDYADFLQKYRQALDNIEEPWMNTYDINLLFFTISIPKDWLKGEYDGIRYFEDKKYALYLALVEKGKAAKAEQQAKDALIEKLESTYLAAKEFEAVYLSSKKIAAGSKTAYERLKVLNKLGKASFSELQNAKSIAISDESAVFSNLLKFNKAISMFNFYSSGKVDQYRESTDFERSTFDSGESFVSTNQDADKNSQKPEWFLKVTLTDYKFEFGLNIPEGSGIDATHYSLFTDNGQIIGEKSEINKTICHLPIAFKDSTKLVLKLYKNNNASYEAEIDGSTYGGELELKKLPSPDSKEAGLALGTWDIQTIGNLISILTLKLDASSSQIYDRYSISINDEKKTEIFPASSIKTPCIHLSGILKDPEKLTVYLYKKDSSKKKLCSLQSGMIGL